MKKKFLAMVILACCSATQADMWEHQSSPWSDPDPPSWALDYPNGMAWVLGPDATTNWTELEYCSSEYQ